MPSAMKSTRGPEWATVLHRPSAATSKMGQKIDLIFQLDQALLHCQATPAEHRLGAPRTSAADLRGDLRLKRSSVRTSQPTAELLNDILALLKKRLPHETPPCRGAILGVRHSLAKVDSETNSAVCRGLAQCLIDQRRSCGRRSQITRQTASLARLPQLRLCSIMWVCW
jgi:hypothetical protein